METQRSKFANGTQKKGGKDVTRMILTASGGVLVGAGAGVAATTLIPDEDPVTPTPAPHETAATEEAVQEQPSAASQQNGAAHQNSTAANEVQPVESGTVSPTDNGQTASTPGTGNGQNNTATPGGQSDPIDPTIADVDPTLIAREITATEIDPNDNDLANMINVDMVDTLYLEDGTEMPVALFHTPDGGSFLMVDVDNDLTFDVITDLEGNPINAVESNLTMSDIEDMYDTSGDYLAFNESQNEKELSLGGNPEDDILVTDLSDGDPWADDDLVFEDDNDTDEVEDEELLALGEEPDNGLEIDDN